MVFLGVQPFEVPSNQKGRLLSLSLKEGKSLINKKWNKEKTGRGLLSLFLLL